MIFTQKSVHVDSNVYFKIVMKHCQISSVNQFSGFSKSLLFFRAMSEFQKFAITFAKMNFYPKIYETAPLFENNSSGPIIFNILRYFSNN